MTDIQYFSFNEVYVSTLIFGHSFIQMDVLDINYGAVSHDYTLDSRVDKVVANNGEGFLLNNIKIRNNGRTIIYIEGYGPSGELVVNESVNPETIEVGKIADVGTQPPKQSSAPNETLTAKNVDGNVILNTPITSLSFYDYDRKEGDEFIVFSLYLRDKDGNDIDSDKYNFVRTTNSLSYTFLSPLIVGDITLGSGIRRNTYVEGYDMDGNLVVNMNFKGMDYEVENPDVGIGPVTNYVSEPLNGQSIYITPDFTPKSYVLSLNQYNVKRLSIEFLRIRDLQHFVGGEALGGTYLNQSRVHLMNPSWFGGEMVYSPGFITELKNAGYLVDCTVSGTLVHGVLEMLADETLRQNSIRAIVNFCVNNGIGVDFNVEKVQMFSSDPVAKQLQPKWINFLEEVTTQMHSHGLRVTWTTIPDEVDLIGGYEIYKYAHIPFDNVSPMFYDHFGWDNNVRFPDEPAFKRGLMDLDVIKDNVASISQHFTQEQLIYALPNYGYFATDENPGAVDIFWPPSTVNMSNGVRDERSGELFFTTGNHFGFFCDQESINRKIDAIREVSPDAKYFTLWLAGKDNATGLDYPMWSNDKVTTTGPPPTPQPSENWYPEMPIPFDKPLSNIISVLATIDFFYSSSTDEEYKASLLVAKEAYTIRKNELTGSTRWYPEVEPVPQHLTLAEVEEVLARIEVELAKTIIDEQYKNEMLNAKTQYQARKIELTPIEEKWYPAVEPVPQHLTLAEVVEVLARIEVELAKEIDEQYRNELLNAKSQYQTRKNELTPEPPTPPTEEKWYPVIPVPESLTLAEVEGVLVRIEVEITASGTDYPYQNELSVAKGKYIIRRDELTTTPPPPPSKKKKSFLGFFPSVLLGFVATKLIFEG